MAKPRVFVSSTYFDLKSVRADIERFIRDKGFDPVLNERGSVTYSKESSPEKGCYGEIENCEILVSIIGGRYGSSSHLGDFSISQVELKTALENFKQVYIFVERDVLAEYRTYLKNKEKDVSWAAVDDIKIYSFLEEIFSLPNNNAVMAFDTAHDIIALLKEQWAGLFQRLLQNVNSESAFETARELRQGIETLRQLTDIMRSGSKSITDNKDDATINSLLIPNHPSFSHIKKLLSVSYRVYFTSLSELNSWLRQRGYKPVVDGSWDYPNFREWYNNRDHLNWDLLKISTSLFDNKKQFRPDKVKWDESLITKEIRPREDQGDTENVF